MGGRGANYGKQKFFDWLANEGQGKGKAHPMDISKFKGWSLEQVEARLRRLGHEELFVFDRDGNVTAAYKGGRDSVAFPASLLREDGVTVTHGHPKSSADFGGTFSFADMRNMLVSDWAEHRATASGQGEMNYILRRTAQSNPRGFYDRINRDYQNLQGLISKTWDDTYRQAKNRRVGTASAIHQARQAAVGVLNRYYKDMAPQYGFEYVTRKTNYRYNR